MRKYTQKQLRGLAAEGRAIDITYGTEETRQEILKKEEYLAQIGYASGIYGCNGQLFEGYKTGTHYVITTRSQAIFIFG